MKKSLLLMMLVALLAAACAGANPAATPLPTSTIIPTYAYVSPTPNAQLATIIATEAGSTPAADTQAITSGQGRYVALDCGSCHGDNAEGNGDKGPALVGLTMSADEFVTYLRTGGKMGSAHQYATNRLSDRGAQNLYLYLKSLTP